MKPYDPKQPVWSRSMAEEVIAVLWLIAALLAFLCHIKWLFIVLCIKAGLDTVAAIHHAIAEGKAERKYDEDRQN